MVIGVAIHIVSAILWLGGLSVALLILKPAVLGVDGQTQLAIWRRGFAYFLPWSWACIAALVSSGVAMAFIGFSGFTMLPAHVRAMMALGLLAIGIYVYFQLHPWRRFRRSVLASDWAAAKRGIMLIRWLLGAALIAGLAAAIAGSAGRYYG